MNTSAKYQVNWTETVGGGNCLDKILWTDRPPDQQADSSIPPKPCLRGYNQ